MPESSGKITGGIGEKIGQLVKDELQELAKAAGRQAIETAGRKVGSLTEHLTEYASKSGSPKLSAAAAGAEQLAEGHSPVRAALSGGWAGLKQKVKGIFGGGKGKQKKLKLTNIEETLDVGVPVRVAYNQWTEYSQFPSFMKKVENVEKESDEKTNWKAQVFWSHRTWEATVIQQVPDYNIVWRSKGAKGHVDGAVTFHEIGPNLTRVMLAMEYHPQGFFERTGNLWRAQGRRARLEFKHYRRHVMTQSILNPDEIEGWRGEIRDGEVVKDHETALREEEEQEQGEREPEAETPEKPEEEEPEEEEAEEGEEEEGEEEEGEEEEKEEPEKDEGEEPEEQAPRERPRRRQVRPVRRTTDSSGRADRPSGRDRRD
ncbi:SRPBCC family protein [Dactylosporangium salmoneum]|uniref:Coenzyme Q-binding protein COQ10 START domain-containing protein n=1 Tax=Dactylosporangium salmoneum TaxID=53361 RepID=A0ABN3H1F8_9ACTN